jgi:hypothetical protein
MVNGADDVFVERKGRIEMVRVSVVCFVRSVCRASITEREARSRGAPERPRYFDD